MPFKKDTKKVVAKKCIFCGDTHNMFPNGICKDCTTKNTKKCKDCNETKLLIGQGRCEVCFDRYESIFCDGY